jgi:putative transposase
MTKKKSKLKSNEIKELMSQDEDFLRPLVRVALQEVLEAEMTEAVGAAKSQRNGERVGYRSGYYTRKLVTRVGSVELRVPQDRQGRFSTEVFERYQRSEKALVGALVEMYVQGVSTRKVKAISEELCGHEFSASTVSELNKKLDSELERFAKRRLEEEYLYVVLDARYERVRDNGVVKNRAVLVAIGIDWQGRRRVIGVELANRESATSWKEFLAGLKERGLRGVRLVVSDSHEGLRQAVAEILTEAAWQRCYVHFLRNALDYLPRKNPDDCLTELRWLYDRRDVNEARQDLSAWLKRWSEKYPKLCGWVEENIEQTWTFYRLPREHHKHFKSTNMLERLNQELKRRTHVIRIFPNEASCLRLIRALASETDDEWLDGACYLNMEALREQSKSRLQLAA